MFKLKTIAAVVTALCIQSTSVYSATIDEGLYKKLHEVASHKSFVRVLVGLDMDLSLSVIGEMSPKFKQELAEKEQAVLDELGDTVSLSGQWKSGLGQMNLYVTTEGLERLANSRHVKGVMRSPIDNMLATFFDDTGTLVSDIEAEIDKNGFADVEVVLNLKNLVYDYLPDGKSVFSHSEEQDKELATQLPLFTKSLRAKHVTNLTSIDGKNDHHSPVQRLRIDKEGFFDLREHQDIRALRLVNHQKKVTKLDREALESAKITGSAGVTISLSNPFGYSPQEGCMASKGWDSQTAMLKRTFKTILSTLGKKGVKNVQEFNGSPSIYADLSYSALQQLYKNPDLRIKKIRLNKGAYGPLLNISTSDQMMNMAPAWNHSPQYRGAGQKIVIMDSAVDKNHPFLQKLNGQSKVVFEACFGTTGAAAPPPFTGGTEQFVSICDPTNSIGDTPLTPAQALGNGVPGSASPSICSGIAGANNLCNHGTYVAGIAAGGYEWGTTVMVDLNWNPQTATPSPATLTGVAPEADIMAISIMSLQTSGAGNSGLYPRLWGTNFDLNLAMQTIESISSANSPTTISLSVGNWVSSSANCQGIDPTFEDAVVNLNSKNIPVVAATGNKNKSTGVLWPACTPGVIKVGGTIIDDNEEEVFWGNGHKTIIPTTQEVFGSNMSDPSSVSDPIILAPACVFSSAMGGGTSGGQVHGYCGTSASTPHVAGIYALIKQVVPQFLVADATAWLMMSGSEPIDTGYGYNVNKVKIPNLQ